MNDFYLSSNLHPLLEMEGLILKIHEYQAHDLMKKYGIPVLPFRLADSVKSGLDAAHSMFDAGMSQLAIKAQIHAGGRGKAGGIALVRSVKEAEDALRRILGMRLVNPQTGPSGKLVRKVMIVSADNRIQQEFYVGLVLDRDSEAPLMLVSAEGGVDIEETSQKKPESITRIGIDPYLGLLNFQIRTLADKLGLTGKALQAAFPLFSGLYKMFIALDCSQIEINPLVLTDTDDLYPLDAKINLDESAFFKHPELVELKDSHEETEQEVSAARYHLNYVKLDGEIGCMVNGAGLAMATMDTISMYGGKPANFLDIGGSAGKQSVTEAFKILLSDPDVEAVLVNIFAGIVRCDWVAEGIIAAVEEIRMERPLVVRLAGTNSRQGMALLKESGLPLHTATTLEEAAERVVALARGGRVS